MYTLLRPLLFLLPAEWAHTLGLWTLRILGKLSRRPPPTLGPVEFAGLKFAHPIALAAGLDKDGVAVDGLFSLGFSGVEVGTVTPKAQPGNPKPRLFRLASERALVNRMGFNNGGASALAARLRALKWRPGPVGVNVGKNKDTPLEHAVDDYVACLDETAALADYVVVNTSSPNTPGLRQLQEPEELRRLLRAVRARLNELAPGRPLFLKFSPDLGPEAIDSVVDVAIECGLQGLIATNTTITRPVTHPLAKETGGLSGAPLRSLATDALRRAASRANGRLALIASGGVLDARDVHEKLKAGASLVQVYTGLIYGGPGIVRRMLRELAALRAQ